MLKVLLFCLLICPTFSLDPLLSELLERNGDVYLLVSDGNVGYLYMFDRSDLYKRNDVLPTTNSLAPRLPQYVGFSVDKFGHVKLFRTKPDIDSPNGTTSIKDLLSRSYPGSGPMPAAGSNSMNLPGGTSVFATPAGWRYVISPTGEEGWKLVYTISGTAPSHGSASTDLNATQGTFRLKEDTSAFPAGSYLLPPRYKSYPLMYYVHYHSGFWQGGRQSYRVEQDEIRTLSVARPGECCGGNYTNPLGQTWHNEWFDMPLNDKLAPVKGDGNNGGCYYIPYGSGNPRAIEALWDEGATNCDSKPLSPPMGAFFMLPHVVHKHGAQESNLGSYQQVYPWDYYTALRAASLVQDVRKNVKTLLVDSFLSKTDNDVLSNNAATSSVFNTLQTGRDYFAGVGNAGYSSPTDTALAATVSYAADLGRWNHCGDLCGLGPIPSTQEPPPSPSSTAYASSYGKDQSQQKLYMIKIASKGNGTIQTSVVEIGVTPTGITQAIKVQPDLSAPTGIEGYALGQADAKFGTDINQQVVYKAFHDNLGYAGDLTLPDYVQSLGFSKRRDGRTDYVYYSNMPSSHFTVSSNFWGTGGTVWYAEEKSGQLTLRYISYNHTSSDALNRGSIDAGQRLPLKAIAADGDNNVYIVHSKDTLEGPADMERLFGSTTDRDSLEKNCNSGLYTRWGMPGGGAAFNCASLTSGVGVPIANGALMSPMAIEVTMKQHAGFVVEKLSPIDGSLPEKLGVIPSFVVGSCTTKFYFPLDSPTDITFNADKPALGRDPWTCTMTPAAFNSPDLQNVNVKLAVINVPNPPASGSSTTVDIVNPCDTASATCDSNKNIIEDTEATFRMENPPHFAGVPAVLSQSSDPILKELGNNAGGAVKMISNYLPTGFNYTKTLPLQGEPGTIKDLYWDNDNRIGITIATLMNENLSTTALNLMNGQIGQGTPGTRTLRYRWLVRSYTPPHSLVNYTLPTNTVPYQAVLDNVVDGPPQVKTNCRTIKSDGTMLYPDLENPSTEALQRGLLYDSCWKDMTKVIAASTSAPVYAPENLKYVFKDPGEYKVTLMLGALGFDLNGITYLSDPASVVSAMIVTFYSMPITIAASAPVANPYVYDFKVANTDQTNDGSVRIGSDMNYESQFKSAFATGQSNGRVHGTLGSAPVYPVFYDKAKNTVVTHQDQLTPIVAEGKVRFYQNSSVNYLVDSGIQSKQNGAGSWDFEFECTKSVFNQATAVFENTAINNCGIIGGVPLVDKKKFHPSNYSVVTTGPQISKKYGNDGSSDFRSTRSGRLVLDNGTVLESSDFQALYQGTVARKEYFPPASYQGTPLQDLESSPYAFYTWYDIKYAWVMRYSTPSSGVKTAVIKTGNLAEIYLLNLYAKYGTPTQRNNYTKLNQNLAPEAIWGNGVALDSGVLIQKEPGQSHVYHFRIPLINNGALFKSDDSDILKEMNGQLNGEKTDAALDMDYLALINKIHPLRFPIPTGATVLEVSCQVFSPLVVWNGQEAVLDAAGNPTGSFSYYDVVPAEVNASSQAVAKTDNFNQLQRDFKFGGDIFRTWKSYASQRTPSYAGADMTDLGIWLSKDLPGLNISDDGLAVYQFNQDSFARILVQDLENPLLAVDAGGSQALVAGRANAVAMRLTGRDNAPFQHWLDQSGTRRQQGLPLLSNFYYVTGMDPRNRKGLGLLKPLSYGFLLSQREERIDQSAWDSNQAYRDGTVDDWFSRIYPAMPSVANPLQTIASHFHYYNEGLASPSTYGANRANDRFLNAEGWDSLKDPMIYKAGVYPADPYWNRPAKTESVFPVDAVATEVFSYFERNTSANRGANYQMLQPHLNDGDTDVFEFPKKANNATRRKIVLKTESENPNCLKINLPHQEIPSNCFKTATYEVETSSILAPFFFNNDYRGKTYASYGVVQDARAFDLYQQSSAITAYNLGGFFYRLSGKSNADVNMGRVNSSLDIPSMLNVIQEEFYTPEAQRLGDVTYSDRTPPNLRVAITDFKTRMTVYFAVTTVQGLDKDSNNDLNYVSRLNIYRSEDPRSGMDPSATFFQAQPIKKEMQDVAPVSSGSGPVKYAVRVSEYASSLNNQAQIFYQIPEDTRFEVVATASDNVTGRTHEVAVEIASGNCGAARLPDLNSFGMQGAEPVFAGASKNPGQQYRDMAEVRGTHYYPRNNLIDEIRVQATDLDGNQMALCVPVHVVPQSVHFRSIGQEVKNDPK